MKINMFENIDKIEWEKLRQADGFATNVPSALRGLVSDDPEVQRASYWKLDNHVVLQSDLFEAAYYVIPYLLEIVKMDQFIEKKYVYDLLYEIANGYAPDESLCVIDGQSVPLKTACRKAVSEGIDLYFSELKDNTSPNRDKALELLVSLAKTESTILPALKDVLAREKNLKIKKLLEESVNELSHY